jgi:ligand-binding sensor domain-containing protein
MYQKAEKRLAPYLLTLIILLTTSMVLNSQSFNIKTYTTKEGLSHNNARAIVRDSTGFIWIGTWDGLSRFDGHEFKNYFHIPRDSASLPYFSVFDLQVDCDNNLWILTDFGQVVKYNRGSDNFTILRSINGVSIEHAINIYTDTAGHLWIINHNEIIKWDDRTKESEVIRLKTRGGLPFNLDTQSKSISFLKDSAIWIISPIVYEFKKTGKNLYTIEKEYPIIRSPRKKKIEFDFKEWFSLFNSASDNKWIFSNSGLYKLDKERGVFKEFREDIPLNEFTGRKAFCWGWVNDGIYIYNTEYQKLINIPDHKTKIPVAILPLKNNLLWFSGYSSSGVPLGISQIVMTSGFFDNCVLSDPDSAAPAIYSVIIDKYKNIWTGIRGYDHIVQIGPEKKIQNLHLHGLNSLPVSSYIRSMIPVEDGIWIGYFSGQLQFYDYKSSKFINHFPEAGSFRAILANKEGNIFIGTTNLAIYYPLTGKTEILYQLHDPEAVFRLYQSTDGMLWACMSSSSVLKYDPKTREGKIIKLAAGQSNVEDIISGENGELWLALLGEGVCRYNPTEGTFRFYTTSTGLSSNTTYCLLKDRSGNIWVSTNNGISRINPETGQIRIFGMTDGLGISEFNSGAKFIADDGKFILGGMGGYVSFYPDSLKFTEESSNNQQLILTNFEVSGVVRHLPIDLNEADTIILSKGENNFHLSFSSTDFVNSDKTLYRYRLSGVNRNWMETNARNRNINYSNLKPGWYDLFIQPSDVNGDWSASRKLVIRIIPNFYETRLFIIISSLLLLSTLALSIIFYIRSIKQKERQKQYELKLQSLRGQMNPHFIFNSLNSINYFISNNDKLSANRYIADFSRLIRSILANMGNNFIPFDNEISSIEDYLRIEHLRFGDKFDYKIDTEEITDKPETEVCPGIVQPFIENAIWHGVRALENRKGFILIKFVPSANEGIKCFIEDDGVGRMASISKRENTENHRSRGISIVTERLQITSKLRKTNYKLEISDLYPEKPETGTRVEVDIPVIKSKK